MSKSGFLAALSEQIGHEFAASQQYVAVAVYYDRQTLPQLASFFYKQAVEERNHAMMMIQYLLDVDAEIQIPGIEAPKATFGDIIAPVAIALEQEKQVSQHIDSLAATARKEGNYAGEQFMQWFVREQVEEVSTMSDLLAVIERARDNPLMIEDFLAREQLGGGEVEASAPAAAGGAL